MEPFVAPMALGGRDLSMVIKINKDFAVPRYMPDLSLR
jgi:hypothetical protein